ncbi:cysteine proteinase [Delitschia confertaspora ATCC 74209]|uniref:Cysteine proteinase n=1 Tax=Delitschia confertaspora ATCC 74209 TaxID=1513339 RepID=A0A9P4MQW5_9PLEO|nr:cysteine proteinase [Delitschia confertaspora ATCC 74209]
MEPPETLEALQARHRKEQRDLVSRITQKKKAASKRTRKGVNDECERLEAELKERQAQELAALTAENTNHAVDEHVDNDQEQDTQEGDGDIVDVQKDVEDLKISSSQPNGSTHSPILSSDAPKKKPNRQKARLARRAAEQEAIAAQAAEEAASLPNLREQEHSQMRELFKKHNLEEKEIRADGHCLYSAVADQIEMAGLGLKPRIQPTIINEEGEKGELLDYKSVRHAAANFIASNPDEFVGFMEEPLDEYLRKIRETGEWGGHMELVALAKTYGVKINVLHSDGTIDRIEPGEEANLEDDKTIWLGYYRHGFGLGEHYNSLRKKT